MRSLKSFEKKSLLISLPGIEPKLLRLWSKHFLPELQGIVSIQADKNSSYTSWAKQGMFVSHQKNNLFGDKRLFLKEKKVPYLKKNWMPFELILTWLRFELGLLACEEGSLPLS